MSGSSPPNGNPIQGEMWKLYLYVAGMSPAAYAALRNLTEICDAHLGDRYVIDVVDLLQAPAEADDKQIVAVPLVVRVAPLPVRKIIGDLSETEAVLRGLGISPKLSSLEARSDAHEIE